MVLPASYFVFQLRAAPGFAGSSTDVLTTLDGEASKREVTEAFSFDVFFRRRDPNRFPMRFERDGFGLDSPTMLSSTGASFEAASWAALSCLAVRVLL